MPYRPTTFNDTVGIDIKWVKDAQETTYYIFNVLDLATCFNLAILLVHKSSEAITHAFKTYWLSWAGPPRKIIADQGREGYGLFTKCMNQLGTHFSMIPVEAPWQLGMVERHGSVLGGIITAIVLEVSPVGEHQMRDVCFHASFVKNRRPGRSGFSPRTAVFGSEERLIASGLNHYLEQPDDAAVSAAQTTRNLRNHLRSEKQR
jgi:hypothetical protein